MSCKCSLWWTWAYQTGRHVSRPPNKAPMMNGMYQLFSSPAHEDGAVVLSCGSIPVGCRGGVFVGSGDGDELPVTMVVHVEMYTSTMHWKRLLMWTGGGGVV